MGPQRAPAQEQAADLPDGFGVAVVREDGKWRCSPMRPAALTSLAAAETELRELRSAGAVFGLLDVDDEFFVIVRPAPAGTRLLSVGRDGRARLRHRRRGAGEARRRHRSGRPRRRRPVRGGRSGGAVRHRPARGGAGRDPLRAGPLRRRAAGPHRAGRWASPTSCRRCSTASIGDPTKTSSAPHLDGRTQRGPAGRADRRGGLRRPTGRSWRGRPMPARSSVIRPRTPRSWRCARRPRCSATAGGWRARRWR